MYACIYDVYVEVLAYISKHDLNVRDICIHIIKNGNRVILQL